MVKYCDRIIRWLWQVVKKRGPTFAVGVFFAIFCFIGLNAAMEPVSKSVYCGTNCHEMETAYQSWKLSIHGTNPKGLRVECFYCHLPPKDKYFTHVATKAYLGAKDLYKHRFGGEYDVEKTKEKVIDHFGNGPCLHCHVDLLAKPSNEEARESHIETLKPSDPSEQVKCIDCHEEAGHLR